METFWTGKSLQKSADFYRNKEKYAERYRILQKCQNSTESFRSKKNSVEQKTIQQKWLQKWFLQNSKEIYLLILFNSPNFWTFLLIFRKLIIQNGRILLFSDKNSVDFRKRILQKFLISVQFRKSSEFCRKYNFFKILTCSEFWIILKNSEI